MAIVSGAPCYHRGSPTLQFPLPSVLLILAGIVGCDTGTSTPVRLPAPPAATDATSDSETSVPTIALILPSEGLADRTVWEQSARVLLPRANALAEVITANPGEQAKAVRDVVHRGASAIILVAPDESESDLPAALKEVRESTRESRGRPVPILLAVNGIDIPGEKFPVLRFSSIDVSSQQLVNATIEDARKAGFSENQKAAILYNGPFGVEGRVRVDAVRKALVDAKVEIVPEGKFVGYQAEATELINSVLESHPDLAMMIATEDQAAKAAATVRDHMDKTGKRFVLGVIGPQRELEMIESFNVSSGLVIRDGELLARRALKEALGWSRGNAVSGEDLIVEAPFKRTTGKEREGFAPLYTQSGEEQPTKP